MMQHFGTLKVIHEEGEFLELDGHVGGTRCEAEVVGKAVAWVGQRGFCAVLVSGGGTRAIYYSLGYILRAMGGKVRGKG
jgi:hypothetical protein